MKKSVVLAMAMALGVSVPVFAANPFSDLPRDHWAYSSVAKLAAAGIVDGYPDGMFKGDRTITRYEMAQLVAKALAKGAIAADDKLVSEFADELDGLGVRVAKLERNADNMRITGNIRISYRQQSGAKAKGMADKGQSRVRSRLMFTGEINDNWKYHARIENNQYFQGKNESGEAATKWGKAELLGNVGITKWELGRYAEWIGDGNVYDARVDAIKTIVPMGKGYVKAAWGKMATGDQEDWQPKNVGVAGRFGFAEAGGDLGNLNLVASYTKAKNEKSDKMGVDGDNSIWTIAADYKAGDWKFGAMYLKGDNDALADQYKGKGYDDDGYVLHADYKGATANKPGSWGLYAKYYDQAAVTHIAHTMCGMADQFPGEGFKGYLFGGSLTVAKNMVGKVEYYDLKGKASGDHGRTLWSQLVVTF